LQRAWRVVIVSAQRITKCDLCVVGSVGLRTTASSNFGPMGLGRLRRR